MDGIEGVAVTREKPDYIEKSREAVWDAGERAIVKSLDATIENVEASIGKPSGETVQIEISGSPILQGSSRIKKSPGQIDSVEIEITASYIDDEGGEETPEEEAEQRAAIESESDYPSILVMCSERTGKRLQRAHALSGLMLSTKILIAEEASEEFRHFPPNRELREIALYGTSQKIERARLLRTLDIKRLRDIIRGATWPDIIDDPDSFMPPSEEVMKRTRAWYTEAFPIRLKKDK